MMFNDAERDNREKRRKKGKYLALVLLLKLMNIGISISLEVKYLKVSHFLFSLQHLKTKHFVTF